MRRSQTGDTLLSIDVRQLEEGIRIDVRGDARQAVERILGGILGQVVEVEPGPDGAATISLAEAGALLGMKQSATYAAVKAGRFPVKILEVGGRKRVARVALQAVLSGRNV